MAPNFGILNVLTPTALPGEARFGGLREGSNLLASSSAIGAESTQAGFFSSGQSCQPRTCRGLTNRGTGYLQLWASPERQNGRRRQHPRTQGYRASAAPKGTCLKANLVQS